MGKRLSVSSCDLDGFEGLHQAVQGSHVDVMQLRRGTLRGTLSHVGIGDFSLSIGSFNLGVRTQRTSSDEKLIVGMLLSAEDRVTHFTFDMRPADVLVIPPAVEHDGIFHGASSYAALRFDLSDVTSMFAGEARLSDPATWREKNRYRADPAIATVTAGRLPQIVSRLAQLQDVSDGSVRRFLETRHRRLYHRDDLPVAATRTGLARCRRRCGSCTMSKTISPTAGARPVHVSELCAAFRVSRRGLHRAFQDVFGIGPISFLRHKRLCAIHSVLRDSNPAATTVAQVAIQHGFIELGRFSHYYHSLFGEYPSETLGARPPRARSAAGPHFAGPLPLGLDGQLTDRVGKAGRGPADSGRRYGPAAVREQQPTDLGGRNRRAEQKPLHLGAAEDVQQFRCCSVSTPSAVVVMLLAAAMFTTAWTIDEDAPSPAISLMKERSILILSNGNRCR